MRFYILIIAAFAYVTYVSSDACVQCNSATDARCAVSPAQFMAKDCANKTSKCFTRIDNRGNTIRGCESDLDNNTRSRCNNENECVICAYMEGCNRQVFPSHRLQCIQCEGNSTGICALDTRAMPAYCPIYKLGDKCFVRNNGRNTTTGFRRGCLSTVQQEQKLCIKDGNCFTCEGNGCNFLDVTDPRIPTARDSAGVLASSLALLLVAFIGVRFV